MITFISLVITVVLLVIQGFINATLPYSLELTLAAGLAVYFLMNRSAGLTIMLVQALVIDLTYHISLPVNIITLVLVYFIWRWLIEQRLVLSSFTSQLLSMLAFLLAYYITHWLLSWLPYWLGDQIIHPSWFYLWSYLISVLLTMVFLAVMAGIIFFLKHRFYVKR